MKKTAFAAFVAFWASTLTLWVTALLAPASTLAESGESVYNLSEVSRHNQETDCWVVVKGAVYDLTEFMPMHPASPSVIVPWCGRDATEGMTTKGYGRDHSDMAWNLLQQYRIGTFADSPD